MPSIIPYLWLIPALPILAAGIIALLKQRHRALAATLAISSIAASLILSLCAFAQTLAHPAIATYNFPWLQFGDQWLSLGWMLDPLTAIMLVMVTFVGLLIFIYSIGYMAHDENFTRFFCFLALFAGAMLGVLISNSLLLLFMCWEIVGLTSYLLIGFWYANPRAAAAAKKAFLTTRIGDLGLLVGMVWLYAQSGTLLFYNHGAGCLESSSLSALTTHTTILGLTISSAIAILIFCGAAGKSGQFPLHVWLPDAMEGPTPVSALIHAATMVAAGVFLIARCYPLFAAGASHTIALEVVTWTGAITALLGALIAVAQYDIKRILAYSTISQLGYMMIGLGIGGPSVGIFHLITHAFFKALLFLGAGSLIHGCSGEQDIRRMGGLGKHMPITFAAYTAGMLALCGFPLFSGFWSKDAILHAAHLWSISQAPFYIGAFAALLTAFYMTRQLYYVFAGHLRHPAIHHTTPHDPRHDLHLEPLAENPVHHPPHAPHESPAVMTIPLVILAAFAVFLGLIGTPAWPWFQSFLEGTSPSFSFAAFHEPGLLPLMLTSSLIVFLGLGLGWLLYGRKPILTADSPDPLATNAPRTFNLLTNAFHIDALYAATLLRLNAALSRLSAWLDQYLWNGIVQLISTTVIALAWIDNFLDAGILNTTFDSGCDSVSHTGDRLALIQTGRIQTYLRALSLALIALVILLLWGMKA
ncbi:MAG TPA: NADH-quinone oxidoreductase subunit L [Acidobacteriaceae bacterium]|nr:NADH-quinone oxidoreductase subunit L [Acidobacteriaceae bacterium]